jgi:hypothetical protein
VYGLAIVWFSGEDDVGREEGNMSEEVGGYEE